MKLIKRYKGMEIYKLDNGNYRVLYFKPNICDGILERSKEFPSIRKCKDFINDLGGIER